MSQISQSLAPGSLQISSLPQPPPFWMTSVVPRKTHPNALGTVAYSSYLCSILAICFWGYTSGCFITQNSNSVILNFHVPFSKFLLFLVLSFFYLLNITNTWPSPIPSDTVLPPGFIPPSLAFLDPNVHHLNSHQHH